MMKSTTEINYRLARGILFEEAAKAAAGYVDPRWVRPIETLSEAAAGSLTHIAFLGTAILAKSTQPSVDVFAVKKASGPRGYSARGLCHLVLVPNAPELDINLGVTGREPLNNQPYFRIDRLTRDAPVRTTAREVLNQLCDILEILDSSSDQEARQALRAFIEVRRRYGNRYARTLTGRTAVSVSGLIAAIGDFVSETSDGGRRAQAIVAALMDIFAGEDRVDARRINDPSRTTPADVNVRRAVNEGWERVFEVRDKAVSREDLYLLATKCADADVSEAVMVAIAPSPSMTLIAEARAWSAERGVALSIYSDWTSLVQDALHWAPTSTLDGAALLPSRIEQRLVELAASQETLENWQKRIASASDPQPKR